MKKTVAILLVVVMVLALAACGQGSGKAAEYKLGMGISLSMDSSATNNAQVDATVATVVTEDGREQKLCHKIMGDMLNKWLKSTQVTPKWQKRTMVSLLGEIARYSLPSRR